MKPSDIRNHISQQCGFNKAKQGEKLPTSFSDWLASNQDSIDIGGNEIPDRVQANHDIYKNGNPFQ